MGGDVDTEAAMIGDISGALYGREWIPSRCYDHIEPNSEENIGRRRDLESNEQRK